MDSHIVQGPLAGMVDYQAGAVVSKTLVDKPAGTVTLFAFDQGQGLSEHAAPFDALVQVLDGRAEVRIAEALFRVEAGGLIVIPAHAPHALKAHERFKMLLTMIRT